MRRFAFGVIVGFIAVALIRVAAAADIAKAPAYRPTSPPVFDSWTGFYFGLNAGWVGASHGSQQLTGTDTDDGGLGFLLREGHIPAALGLSPSGVIGGGQIGYNWQISNWLAGLESDFDGTSLKGAQTGFGLTPGLTGNYSQTLTSELNWLATLRGRVGVIWAHALFYATGGLAVAQTKVGFSSVDLIDPIPPLNASSFSDTTRAGWTVGAGLEWKFTSRWSVKAEYLYVDLGTDTRTVSYAYTLFTTNSANNSTLTVQVKERYNIARVGVNFHF